MKKANIIKKSDEFTDIIKNSRYVKNNSYVIYYRKNDTDNRYGISIPKKTGKAVIRNKLKRQIKSIIDNNKKDIQNNFDYVIIVRKGLLDLKYLDMEKELLSLLKKIGE